MKILKFSAENVKGLRVVEISPAGDVVTISGKNGAGKSSILDAIQATLCGGDLPLLKGAERGEVTIDLGDYTVTRIITEKTDRLVMTNKKGAVYKSPRDFLSKFIGPLSIDPLAFIRFNEREQINILFRLCPGLESGLNDADKKMEEIKSERSVIRREGERIRTELERMPQYTDVQTTEISVAELTAELNLTMKAAAEIAQQKKFLGEKKALQSKLISASESFKKEKKELESRLKAVENELNGSTQSVLTVEEDIKKMEGAMAEPPDIKPIMERIASADLINAKIRANAACVAAQARRDRLGEQYTAKGKEIHDVEKSRATLLSTAKLPVPGLSVEAGKITIKGIPISNLSTAEKVRIGALIAVAQNPKAKIILADDVSLLDSENLKILHEICSGFQLWEVLNDDSGNQGFYIEEGKSKPEIITKKEKMEPAEKKGMF